MQILVNGESTDISVAMSMSELIDQLGLGERRLAVEVNQELVPRSRFSEHELKAGDQVEIIHAVGGG